MLGVWETMAKMQNRGAVMEVKLPIEIYAILGVIIGLLFSIATDSKR